MEENVIVIPIPRVLANRERLAQFDNRIKPRVYIRGITRCTIYEKAPFCKPVLG